MRVRWMVLWLAVWMAGSAVAQEPSSMTLDAVVAQKHLPALNERFERAEAMHQAREAWWTAEGSFDDAFPLWSEDPLDDAVVLKGRLLELQAAEVARAAEARVQEPKINAALLEAWRASRAEALAAEARADASERRLLTAALGVLTQHPHLAASASASLQTSGVEGSSDAEAADADIQAMTVSQADRASRRRDKVVAALIHAHILQRDTASLLPRLDAVKTWGDVGLWSVLWAEYGPEDRTLIAQALDAAIGSGALGPPPADRFRPDGATWSEVASEGMTADGPGSAQSELVARAEEAEREAAEQLAAARDSRERRRAEIKSGLAQAQRFDAEVGVLVEEREQEAVELARRIDEVMALADQATAAIDERALGERPNVDGAFIALRSLNTELRAHPAMLGGRLLDAEQRADSIRERVSREQAVIKGLAVAIAGLDEPMLQAELDATLSNWAATLVSSARAADRLERTSNEERDRALSALRAIREARRVLGPWVSRVLREQDGSYAIEDLVQEVSTLGPSLVMRVRHRASSIRELPARLTDYNLLRGGAAALLWTLVLGGAWLAVRSYVGGIATSLVHRFVSVRPGLRPSDGQSLRDPVERFLRALLDLLIGWLLVERLGEVIPELGLLLLVYLHVALYRWVVATFDLLVVSAEEARPALLALRQAPFQLARRTVSSLTMLLIARAFVHRLMWGWMGLDVLVGLVDAALMLWIVGFVVLSLHRWEPHLRSRMQSRDQDSFIVSFLSRPPEFAFLQALRGLATVTFFGVAALVDLVFLVARERTGVAWVLHALNWVQAGEETDDREPLEPALVERLASPEHVTAFHAGRPEVRERLVQAWTSWRVEQRGGLLALVGDRGSGRVAASAHLEGLAKDGGLPVVSLDLPHDLGGFSALSAWLCRELDVPKAETGAQLAEVLAQAPPSVIVLKNLDRVWSRQVGGFSALGRLLDAMNGSSDLHFWVFTFHTYAWGFLSSDGSLVDLAVVRHVVRLPVMSSEDLRVLTASALASEGLSADFSGLIRTSLFGGDRAVEEERAIQLYFRLLAESSSGNARVALRLWSECLSPAEEPGVVRVAVAEVLRGRILQGLNETALFTLVAVRLQEELGEAELASVTNLPRHLVRTTLRDLIARGLITRLNDRLSIPDAHLPSVTRTLRRRHFLHLEA